MKHTASIAPGIRRHGAGFQVCAKAHGERQYSQWPRDAGLKEMQAWKKDTEAILRLQGRGRQPAGTFAADARKYLSLPDVKAMPTFTERERHIDEWIVVFGSKRRRAITSDMIAAERDRLFTEPRESGQPYAASSVNHRLRALANLWTRLDGKHAPNPARDVPECEEPPATARGLPYSVIEAILEAIPDHATGKTKDGTLTKGKPRPSKTKARLRVIAYTGLSHTQLGLLQRTDVDLERGTMRLVARKKGRKRTRALDQPLPQLITLIPEAVAAFKTFNDLHCWGPFSRSSMWKAFDRACAKLDLTGLRPYDFRHSYLSVVYDETKDLRVTGTIAGHRSVRTTERYTLSTVAPHVAAAAAKVAARFAGAQSGVQRPQEQRILQENSGRQSRAPRTNRKGRSSETTRIH